MQRRSLANTPRIDCISLQHSIHFQRKLIFFLTYVDIRVIFAAMKKRTTVWLPEELVGRLKKLSRKTGAPSNGNPAVVAI